MATISFRPTNEVKLEYATRIASTTWEPYKNLVTVRRKDKMAKRDILRELEVDNGFCPSLGQLNAQMRKWGIEKPGRPKSSICQQASERASDDFEAKSDQSGIRPPSGQAPCGVDVAVPNQKQAVSASTSPHPLLARSGSAEPEPNSAPAQSTLSDMVLAQYAESTIGPADTVEDLCSASSTTESLTSSFWPFNSLANLASSGSAVEIPNARKRTSVSSNTSLSSVSGTGGLSYLGENKYKTQLKNEIEDIEDFVPDLVLEEDEEEIIDDSFAQFQLTDLGPDAGSYKTFSNMALRLRSQFQSPNVSNLGTSGLMSIDSHRSWNFHVVNGISRSTGPGSRLSLCSPHSWRSRVGDDSARQPTNHMRDFTCCEMMLPTLNDLSEHYEAYHASGQDAADVAGEPMLTTEDQYHAIV